MNFLFPDKVHDKIYMPVGVEPKFTTHYTHPAGDCAVRCGNKVYSIHILLPINSYSFAYPGHYIHFLKGAISPI